MHNSSEKVLARLASDAYFKQSLEHVIAALRSGYDRPDAIELF